MKKITGEGAGVLRKTAESVPIPEIRSTKIKRVIADMKEALLPHKDGVALAAPQIGVSLRIFVVSGHVFNEDALLRDDKSKKGDDLVFINPEIISVAREKKWMPEGCLSVRPWYGEVKRATKVTIRAYDESGKKITRGASGLLAHIFQHEIDHLDGILFTDKARNVERIAKES
jgi:peptide deformylase